MKPLPWKKSELAKLRRHIFRPKGSVVALAAAMGRSEDAVRSKLKVLRRLAKESEAAEAKDEAKKKIEKQFRQFVGCDVSSQKCDVKLEVPEKESAQELWSVTEQRNAGFVARASQAGKISAEFKESQPIAVAFISDQHIDENAPTDLLRMRIDAETIRDTPNLYACLIGDGVNNHIKHRAAVINSASSPMRQYAMYNYYLQLFGDKILALTSGNHDLWTQAMSGVDMVDTLAKMHRICYTPHQAVISLSLPGYTYKILMRHQYRFNSELNQTHTVKQLFRHGETQFDVGAVAHHHEAAIEGCLLHGQFRWVLRPGAYQITSGYSEQFGFNPAVPTCPTVVFYPETRHMVGFLNMYDACLFLEKVLGR